MPRQSLAGLKMVADTQLAAEVVNTTINTSVKSFVQKDHKIDDIAVDLGLHNLDAGWLNQFTKESQKIQGDPQAMQMLLMQGMQQLLARKPEPGSQAHQLAHRRRHGRGGGLAGLPR